MELSVQEGEIPIPLPINTTTTTTTTTSYVGGGHGHGHNMVPTPLQNLCSNGQEQENHHHVHVVRGRGPYKQQKMVIRYRECLKNHAVAMGGNATDGCGEFMPNGEDGTIEAFNCSACHCHRNFHRKEVEGDPTHEFVNFGRKKFLLGPPLHPKNNNIQATLPEALGYPTPSRSVPHHCMVMPYTIIAASEYDEQEDGGVGRAEAAQLVKKWHRTKFSHEQKEKMLRFAEKVGWKTQKQEESLVQQFCQEIGVKRRMFKVWMHNNKNNLGKKKHQPPSPS